MERSLWDKIRASFFAMFVYYVARLIGVTLRFKVYGEELLPKEGGKIIAGWHGRTFLAALHFRNRNYWALISQSRDGDMQNKIFQKFGFRTVRGSTKRGGARAAVECARLLKKGETFVWTPDGPRGPTKKVQDGILWLAQNSGAKIIPAGAASKPRKLFSSWDKYMIPYPFAKSAIVIGEPIAIPKNATQEEYENFRTKLEKELNHLEQIAEEKVSKK